MAIAALVLGIASLVVCWIPGLGLVLGVVGIILAVMARKENDENKGMVTAGLVCAIIGAVLGLIITSCTACTACLGFGALEGLNSFYY